MGGGNRSLPSARMAGMVRTLMDAEKLAQAMCDYLKGSYPSEGLFGPNDEPYVDDENLKAVCVDGWIDMVALAKFMLNETKEAK